MQKINLFLAVSDELEKDKLELSNFIRDLNEWFEDYGIYFKLITDKDAEILNSKMFITMCSSSINEQLKNRFDMALQSFRQTQFPKISTYFKKDTELKDERMETFLKYLGDELGHYYNFYENIDTIKLNILLQIKNLDLNTGVFETKNSKIMMDGKELLSIQNIPMISNNKDLKKLKEQYQQTEEEYWKYKSLSKESDDEEIIKHIETLKKEKDSLEQQIDEIEEEILEVESTFLSMEGFVSKRQIYAKECLDRGDILGAKEALDFAKLKHDGEKYLKELQIEKQKIRCVLGELKQRISILKLDIKNSHRWLEIEECLKEMFFLEKEAHFKIQNDFYITEFLDVFKNLALFYDEDEIISYTFADILEKNGALSMEYYQKYIKILEVSQEKDKDYGILSTYMRICKYYDIQGMVKEYEEIFLKMIDTYERYFVRGENIYRQSKNPEYLDADFRLFYQKLSMFYKKENRIDEAISYCIKSMDLYIELFQKLHYDFLLDLIDEYQRFLSLAPDENLKKEYYDKIKLLIQDDSFYLKMLKCAVDEPWEDEEITEARKIIEKERVYHQEKKEYLSTYYLEAGDYFYQDKAILLAERYYYKYLRSIPNVSLDEKIAIMKKLTEYDDPYYNNKKFYKECLLLMENEEEKWFNEMIKLYEKMWLNLDYFDKRKETSLIQNALSLIEKYQDKIKDYPQMKKKFQEYLIVD